MSIPVIDTGRGHWHAVHLHEEEGYEAEWLAALAADRADALLTCIEFVTYLSLHRVAVVRARSGMEAAKLAERHYAQRCEAFRLAAI